MCRSDADTGLLCCGCGMCVACFPPPRGVPPPPGRRVAHMTCMLELLASRPQPRDTVDSSRPVVELPGSLCSTDAQAGSAVHAL